VSKNIIGASQLSIVAFYLLPFAFCHLMVVCHRPIQTQPGGEMKEASRLEQLLNDPARRNKLDGALIVRLQELVRDGRPEEALPVLVQISGDFTEMLRACLSDAGLFIQVRVGDVLTGSIRASDLERLLACQEVQRVALSQERHLNQ
jgi:hypothetical protein